MSGRGKGGKGLGKGGAKRHRKVLRDNIQGKFASVTHCARARARARVSASVWQMLSGRLRLPPRRQP